MKPFYSLLLFVGALLFCGSARAWDEPSAPQRPQFSAAWVTPVIGGQYYVYNEGASQFLGTGLDWGTRTCTTVDSVVTVNQAKVTVSLNRNLVVPFEITESDLEEYIQLRTMNTSKGDQVFISSWGADSWSDFATSDDTKWSLTQLADGAYVLEAYNSVDHRLGVKDIGTTTSYVWADAKDNGTYSIAWRFMEATEESATAVKTYCHVVYQQFLAEQELYEVRKALYDVLVEAEALGIDNTAAGAVYTSDGVTLEELKAALAALKAEVDSKAFWAGVAASSQDNPFDVTKYVMTNADFSASCENGKTPPGWEITATGTNIGQMNRTDVNPDDETLYLQNFVECWTPAPATLGDGYIGQWVTGLPQGRYRLTMEAAACNQSGGFDPTTVTGVYLFAGNGRFNLHSEESVAGAPYDIRHYEWDFDFNAEKLLLGLLFEKTNANWVSADNFHLLAIGPMQENPDVAVLRTALEQAWEMADLIGSNNIDDTYQMNANADVIAHFEQVLQGAEDALQSGDGEQARSALEALNTATADLQTSAATYKSYQELYLDAMEMADKLKQLDQWPALQTQIIEWAGGTLTDAFNEGTLTEETLSRDSNFLDELVADFVAQDGNVQPGNDLTVLVKNADFGKGQYYSTDTTFDPSAGTIPGWNVTSGNIKELSAEYHNIESYGLAFDFNQTIRNLPAGTYRLTVQGYVRVDYGENDMVLYGGVSSKQFKEITEEYSTTALLGDLEEGGSTGTWPYDTPRSDGQGYQPNSMQGASVYFETINPETDKPFYLNDVTIGHTGGDLTIGLRSDRTNGNSLWILWDNFTLTYVSQEAIQPILEEIDELMKEYDEVAASSSTTIETRNEADSIFARVEKKDELVTTDEALALLQDIKDLIQNVKRDQEAYLTISDVTDAYLAKSDLVTDERFHTLLDEVLGQISGMEFQSRQAIYDYVDELAKAWIAAVMLDALPDTDVTALIQNPDFETLNVNGWEILPEEEGGRVGDNQGYQANATYDNADAGIHIEHFIEAWRANSQPLNNGVIAQELGVLPGGYYRLEADGFATNQAGEPEGGIQGIYLFAQVGEDEWLTPFAPEVDWIPLPYNVTFHADGQSDVIIGLCVRETNSNWFLADNFRLIFLGVTPPDAIREIKNEQLTMKNVDGAVYDLSGRQTTRLHRGFNLVRTPDGNVHKVIVR